MCSTEAYSLIKVFDQLFILNIESQHEVIKPPLFSFNTCSWSYFSSKSAQYFNKCSIF